MIANQLDALADPKVFETPRQVVFFSVPYPKNIPESYRHRVPLCDMG